jgi:RNA polymerase sigma-70 factor (ECF subfamily)
MTVVAERERARDELLVIRCRLGEPQAYEELVQAMERKLFYYIRRFVGSDENAADVLQEVWLAVFEKVGRLNDGGALRSWIYRIAHDKAISRFRHDRTEPTAEAEPIDEVVEETVEPDWSAFDARRVHAALDELSGPHREALTLCFLEGMTYAEIAHVTGASMGLVKSRLHYAKRALRRLLEKTQREGADA